MGFVVPGCPLVARTYITNQRFAECVDQSTPS